MTHLCLFTCLVNVSGLFFLLQLFNSWWSLVSPCSSLSCFPCNHRWCSLVSTDLYIFLSTPPTVLSQHLWSFAMPLPCVSLHCVSKASVGVPLFLLDYVWVQTFCSVQLLCVSIWRIWFLSLITVGWGLALVILLTVSCSFVVYFFSLPFCLPLWLDDFL